MQRLKYEEAKYANLLGYNYQSSRWYDATYKIFNRDYKKISRKRGNSFCSWFRSKFYTKSEGIEPRAHNARFQLHSKQILKEMS